MAEPFEATERDTTPDVIDCVLRRLEKGDVRHVVVATSSGVTGFRFSEALAGEDAELVCVSHHSGFRSGDLLDLDPEYVSELREAKVPVLIATHSLSGVGRAISTKFGGVTPVEMIAHTLRLFGQGMKVCVEVAVMAADAGLVPIDRDSIAIAGSSSGADTALLIKPANASRFFDLKIKEIIAKPKEFE